MPPTTTPDPFALRPDGAAVDPGAYRAAALADARIKADLADDPDTAAVLESGDDGALQELLKAVFAVTRSREGGGRRAAEKKRFDPLPPPLRRRPAAPSTPPAPWRSALSTPSARRRRCPGGNGRGGEGGEGERKTAAHPPTLPLSSPSDTVQLYQQLADAGLQYGPAFRLLRNVHVPEAEG